MTKINLHVDPERMKDLLTVDDYLGMVEGDVGQSVELISKFVTDENGNFLDDGEGRKAIGLIPYAELPEVIVEFITLMKDAASPPPSGRD